jgi:leucyl-tRNA synthetase
MVKDGDGRVMSKRLGNVVSPADVIAENGVDALRIAMFFFAPTRDDISWNDEGVYGARRFLTRVFDTVVSLAPRIEGLGDGIDAGALSPKAKEVRLKCHEAIRRSSEAMTGDLKLNTAIASIMELVNVLRETEATAVPEADLSAYAEAVRSLVKLLAPLAPHLAEELHRTLGGTDTVFRSGWPEFDASALVTDVIEVAVQVNGKVRGRLNVPAEISEEEVVELAKAEPGVAKHLEGVAVRKAIYVTGRLVNLVVG